MFKLPDLPYPSDSLAPVVSDVTMRTHHDKHHAKYVETTNGIMAGKGDSTSSLEEVVRQSSGGREQKLFNQSGQAWNHGFFWESMTPTPSQPSGSLAEAITRAFGDMEAFKAKFVAEGVGQFGSGWVWLVAQGADVSIITTHDGDTALVHEGTPVLVCDLWEHAYYLDYKQDRKGFLEQWIDKVANWPFAEAQYAAAQGSGQPYSYPAPVASESMAA